MSKRSCSVKVFLWIGLLFRRMGPRVSDYGTFSKTNAPILKKHPVYICQYGRHFRYFFSVFSLVKNRFRNWLVGSVHRRHVRGQVDHAGRG